MQNDLDDQSHQTTFRTEIFTSEEELDAENLYIGLSDYKKSVLQEDIGFTHNLLRNKKTKFFD